MKFNTELYDPAITWAGITAIIDFYRTISINQLRIADINAFVTGIDSPFLNVVIDTRSQQNNSADLINQVSNFFEKYHVPWGWFVTPGSYNNDLIQNGFSLIEEQPAMYFDLLKSIPEMISDHITIQEVQNYADLEAWILPISESFQVKEGDDSYLKLNAAILINGSGKLQHFIARYDNNIASSGTLFTSGDAVMLHNLATKTAYAKRGIGTALTLHMMRQARQLGFRHCFLDASDDSFNLYKKIGFKVYSSTLIYSKM